MRRESSARLRRPLARGAVLVAALWLGYLGGLCALTVAPRAVGWDARAVTTGSMEPGVPTGSVVLASPVEQPETELAVGTIAVVRDPAVPRGVYVHRIVGRDDDGLLVTRGDANPAPDATHVPADHVLGRVRAVVPAVGWPVVWWQRGHVLEVLGIVVGSWLCLVAVMRHGTAGRRG